MISHTMHHELKDIHIVVLATPTYMQDYKELQVKHTKAQFRWL